MSISDLLSNFKFKGKHSDINYLKSKDIGDVIVKGLSETYITQPQNPVKFLANWLLNEHRSSVIKEKQVNKKEIEKISISKFEKVKKERAIIEKKKEEEHKAIQNEKDQFIEYIKKSEDLEEMLDELCTKTEKLVNATGVYVYYFDKKRKPVSSLDDEFAHLTEQDVYRLISFSNSHKDLLKGKNLEPEEGVIPEVYVIKEEEQPDQNNNNENNDEEDQDEKPAVVLPLNKQFKNILIEEVIRNPKVKFFREPRLGCLLAIDFSYDSSINEVSLQSSIDILKEFYEEEKQIEEEKKIKLEELKELIGKGGDVNLENMKEKEVNNTQSNNENMDEETEKKEEDTVVALGTSILKQTVLDADGNPIDVEAMYNEINSKKAVLKEFEKKQKQLVIVLDTVGQDRIFSEQEQDFAFNIVKTIVDTRTEQEKKRLIAMRDLRIADIEKEKKWLEETPIDKLPELEEAEFKRYYNEKYEGNPPKEDDEKEDEIIWNKTRFIIKNQLQDDEILRHLFLTFSQYEFIEYERIFQNILYFVGVSNTEINYPETNKLNWKVARKHWTIEILKKIEAYSPFGAKLKHENELTIVNRLYNVFSEYEEEKIREYSFVLARLIELIKICKLCIS